MKSSKSSVSLLTRSLSSTTLTPPQGFIYIEESIVRCLQPILPQHIQFLTTIGIKSVINLADFISSSFDAFIEENLIDLHNIDPLGVPLVASDVELNQSINAINDVSTMSDCVRNVLELLVQLSVKPMVLLIGSAEDYLDCVVIACLRKIQQWSFPSIVSEFRALVAADNLEIADLEQFIENFDIRLESSSGNSIEELPEFLKQHYRLRDKENKLYDKHIASNTNRLKCDQAVEGKDAALAKLLFDRDPGQLITSRVKYDPSRSLLIEEADDD